MQLNELRAACEQFYGLQQSAFSLTPNTDFYVELPSQKQAFDTLMFALSSGEGFVKITGEVGTGKTLLCRRLLNALASEGSVTAYIPNPDLTQSALWRSIARELGLDDSGRSDSQVKNDIQQRLLQLATEGRQVVLVVDEAQCMPRDTLETLRLISNLETERQKLVQIVLFGQPELDLCLDDASLRQLRQRITYSAALRPLNSTQALGVYLQQRLTIAGYRGMPLFKPAALRALWQASGGIPRLVNILAAKALLVGYGSGCRALDKQHVACAVKDTEGALRLIDTSWRWQALLAALVLVIV